tara:strand:- start:342 stop:1385 length:1044 start_codon:yes stop_codon:yes gene_type:complete
MSYSQLLSQYADKMNSARAHTEDYAKQNQDMKAQTLQEKFNSIAEPLTQGAEGLSSFGAAFHTGRKIYNKVKNARANAAKAGKPEEPSTNPSSEGGPTDSAASPSRAAADDPAPTSIEQTGTQGASAGPSDTLGSIPEEPIGGQRVLSAAQESDPAGISAQGAARQNAQTSTANAEDSGAQRLASKASPSTEEGTTQVGQAGEGEAPTDTLAGTGRATGADLSSAPGSGDAFSAPRSLGQSFVKTTGADAESAASSGADAIAQAGTGAEQATSTILQKAGTKALGGIADAAPEALDFLGPVGMGIGAITGLVDLFENIFNKPKTPEEETQTGAAAGEDVAAEQRATQ